jgi:hypothetical protein
LTAVKIAMVAVELSLTKSAILTTFETDLRTETQSMALLAKLQSSKILFIKSQDRFIFMSNISQEAFQSFKGLGK